jgi:hypothetical protein
VKCIQNQNCTILRDEFAQFVDLSYLCEMYSEPKLYDPSWCICDLHAISHLDSRTYQEISRNVLNVTWSSAGNFIFTEQFYKIVTTHFSVCPSRLKIFIVDIVISWTFVFLRKCVERRTDAGFPNISLISEPTPTSCWCMTTKLIGVWRRPLYY